METLNSKLDILESLIEDLEKKVNVLTREKAQADEKILELKYVIKSTHDKLDNLINEHNKKD